MKKSMILLALLPFLAVGLEVTPAFLLVRSEKKSPVTDLSVRLLDKYLAEILGRKLRIINEGQWDKKSPAIVVGDTDYARNAGIKSDKLGSETYVLKSVGNNVIVSGGRKGTYYAALELLEAAGCRVLGMGCRITPKDRIGEIINQIQDNFQSEGKNNEKSVCKNGIVYISICRAFGGIGRNSESLVPF